jgi:hypothetical protein
MKLKELHSLMQVQQPEPNHVRVCCPCVSCVHASSTQLLNRRSIDRSTLYQTCQGLYLGHTVNFHTCCTAHAVTH